MQINGPGETPKPIDPSREEILNAETTDQVGPQILKKLYKDNGTSRMHDKSINTRTDKWCKSLNGLPAQRLPSGGDTHIAARRVFEQINRHASVDKRHKKH
jgi:hypothetical protein